MRTPKLPCKAFYAGIVPQWILSRFPHVLTAVGMCLLLNVWPAITLEAQQSSPVRLYDTHGLPDPQQWTQVLGMPAGLNPKHLVLDNGLIRLTFPADGLDQKAAHVLYVSSGTNYVLASDPYFGDWTYVNASVVTEYTDFWILQNTDDIVSIRLEFANHRNTTLTDQPCPFTKTVTLGKGHYGYVVHVDVAVPQRGEKEVGFGRGNQYTFFYNAAKAHGRPDPTITLYTRNEKEQKNYWTAGLPLDNSFLRFVAVRPSYPGAIRTAEWDATAWGYFYQWTYSAVASYEAYIGVLPYDASKARSITVNGDSATVEVPRDGQYTLFHRENGQYVPALPMLSLKTGTNQIALQGKVLNAPVVAPIANGKDFPEDIARLYAKWFPPIISGILAGGFSHTTAVKSDGTVWTWGANNYGQLGLGNTSDSSVPVKVNLGSPTIQVACGLYHTLAVGGDGTLWGWGQNKYGQLATKTGDQLLPSQISGVNNVLMAAAGYHTLILKSDGTVWGWGAGAWGQLGNGKNYNSYTPVQASGLTGIMEIAAGVNHSVALTASGFVYTWGDNSFGQLGHGTTTNRNLPLKVSGLANVTRIVTGYYHTMALKSDGTVWIWGRNAEGQLGNGTTDNALTPVQVHLSGVVEIAAGRAHTLALTADGTTWAWGGNSTGQLGNGTTTRQLNPIKVLNLSPNLLAISAGLHHNIALKEDGTLGSWGYNSNGQLGDGTITSRSLPVQVLNLDFSQGY